LVEESPLDESARGWDESGGGACFEEFEPAELWPAEPWDPEFDVPGLPDFAASDGCCARQTAASVKTHTNVARRLILLTF